MANEGANTGCTDKLLNETDAENDNEEEDENSEEQLLKDLQTDQDISDIDDDEESVEDLLKALVEDEEAKLKQAFKKRKRSSEGDSVKQVRSEEVELRHLEDDDDISLSQSKAKLRLEIPSAAFEPTDTRKTMSPTVIERNKRARKLLRKHASQSGKIACGVFCICIIFAIGLGVLFLAYWFKIEDLYIVGGIFTGGGFLFLTGFIIVRCTVKSNPEDYLTLYKSSPTFSV